MKKIIVGIIVLVVVVWGGVKLFGTKEEKIKETIKIGVIAPLSGSVAFMGEGLRDAILMAKDDLGKTKHKYEIIFEDGQVNSKDFATAANKLINIDKVNAIIDITSAGNAVSPIAEQNQVLHFGIANDQNIAKGDYNFIHMVPPIKTTKLFVEELQKRNIKKLGIFELKQEGVVALMNALKENLKNSGIEIVTDQMFDSEQKDFKTMIAKAKTSNAQIYLLLAFSPHVEIIAKQINEMGIKTPLTSIQSFELTKERNLFEGQWYVSAVEPKNNYIKKFEDKYKKSPSLGSMNGYDLFNLIVLASESAKDLNSKNESIKNSLITIKNFDGVFGPVTIDNEGIIAFEPAVKIIKEGKPVTIDQ